LASPLLIAWALEQLFFHPAKRGLDGLNLVQDIDAIAPVLDHVLDATHLSFDARQSGRQFRIGFWSYTHRGYMDLCKPAFKRNKVAPVKALSPVLLVRGDIRRGEPFTIADGYHRICASWYIDENAVIPCRMVSMS
jgi:hypothetical protein